MISRSLPFLMMPASRSASNKCCRCKVCAFKHALQRNDLVVGLGVHRMRPFQVRVGLDDRCGSAFRRRAAPQLLHESSGKRNRGGGMKVADRPESGFAAGIDCAVVLAGIFGGHVMTDRQTPEAGLKIVVTNETTGSRTDDIVLDKITAGQLSRRRKTPEAGDFARDVARAEQLMRHTFERNGTQAGAAVWMIMHEKVTANEKLVSSLVLMIAVHIASQLEEDFDELLS